MISSAWRILESNEVIEIIPGHSSGMKKLGNSEIGLCPATNRNKSAADTKSQ